MKIICSRAISIEMSDFAEVFKNLTRYRFENNFIPSK